MSLIKSMHRSFKRNCLGLQNPLVPSVSIPLGVYSQNLRGGGGGGGGSLSGAGALG